MLFGKNWIDQTLDEYFETISNVAEASDTLIFFDTNIIAYMFKLHSDARKEFFQWIDEVVAANRLKVPAWAVNEYLNRVTSKTLSEYSPKSKEPSQILKSLEVMHETASLFVDDSLLRKVGITSGRSSYLSDFKSTIESLRKSTRVFAQQFDSGGIHEEIVSHLSGSILESDLIEYSNKASQNGASRYANRLPPGYLDGEKDSNVFGDLIIWYEILDKSKLSAAIFPKILFISNDEKKDWVYAPKMRTQIVGGLRKSIANSSPEIKIVDPRLVSEFNTVVGHKDITICSLSALIEALSKINGSRFTQLAAAIQINTSESLNSSLPSAESEGTNAPDVVEALAENQDEISVVVEPEITEVVHLDEGNPVVESSSVQEAVAEPSLVYGMEALQDSQYQLNAPSDINEVIQLLKSHNWYVQNPAVEKIRFLNTDEINPSSWFVLGRNVYQAACGNSQKAMEFIGNLDSRLNQIVDEAAQHMLAGIVFEIYFNSVGEFRDKLKFSWADMPLSLVAKNKYYKVKDFIRFALSGYEAKLIFLPGDSSDKIFHISSVEKIDDEITKKVVYVLNSVTVDGIELLRDTPQVEDPWGQISSGAILTYQNIREKLSEELGIPRWAFTTHFAPAIPGDVRFLVPSGKFLYPRFLLLNN